MLELNFAGSIATSFAPCSRCSRTSIDIVRSGRGCKHNNVRTAAVAAGSGARGSDPVSRTAPAACTSGPTNNEPGGFECREGGVCAYPTQPDQPINVVAGRSRLDAISEGRNTRGKRRCSESTCRTARRIRTTTRQAVRAHTGYLGATWALRGRFVPATQCHDEDSKEEKSNRAPSSIVRQGY